MAAISLNLPEDLARESKEIAEKLGVTRAELIRQALRHELDKIEAGLERVEMAEALAAMRQDAAYLNESETLDEGLAEPLPQEADAWWRG